MNNGTIIKKQNKQRSCFVPGCTTGYKSNKVKLTLFSAPRNEKLLEKWSKAIPRHDCVLDQFSVVCETHFDERFIERNFKHVIEGKEVLLPRDRPILKDGAFPTVFPSLPKYFTKKLPPLRSSRKRASPPPSKKQKNSIGISTPSNNDTELVTILDGISLPSSWCKISKPDEKLCIFTSYCGLDFSAERDIKVILNGLSTPKKMVVVHVNQLSFSCFVYVNLKLLKTVETKYGSEVADLLILTENVLSCSGVGNAKELHCEKFVKNLNDFNGILYSKKCQGSATCSSSSRIKSCIYCKSARKGLLSMKSKAKILKIKKEPST